MNIRVSAVTCSCDSMLNAPCSSVFGERPTGGSPSGVSAPPAPAPLHERSRAAAVDERTSTGASVLLAPMLNTSTACSRGSSFGHTPKSVRNLTHAAQSIDGLSNGWRLAEHTLRDSEISPCHSD